MSRIEDEQKATKSFSIDFWTAEKIAEELRRNTLIAERAALEEYNLITGANKKTAEKGSIERARREVV